MEAREQRGLVIAATARGLRRKGQVWSVPSQTNSHTGKKYEVDLHAGTCTCLDHTEGGHKCKHLFAVQYTIQREYSDDGMVMTETESLTVQTTQNLSTRLAELQLGPNERKGQVPIAAARPV